MYKLLLHSLPQHHQLAEQRCFFNMYLFIKELAMYQVFAQSNETQPEL
jgi:hypothetical protein